MLNIGEEASKGNELCQKTYPMLENLENYLISMVT